MKKKIKCSCGCKNTLYIDTDFPYISDVMIGSHINSRVGFKNYNGVLVNKKELIKLLKNDKTT